MDSVIQFKLTKYKLNVKFDLIFSGSGETVGGFSKPL
jgi:hypothetical protein